MINVAYIFKIKLNKINNLELSCLLLTNINQFKDSLLLRGFLQIKLKEYFHGQF